MPAPAAQEGQRSRYQTKLVKPQVVEPAPRRSDEFNGSDPEQRLVVGRRAATGERHRVATACCAGRCEHTDLYVDSNTASVLVRDAPAGDYVVETKVRLSGSARRGLLLQLRPGRAGGLRRRRQLRQADRHLDLGDAADRVRQGDQPGARGVEPLRQHRRRAPRRTTGPTCGSSCERLSGAEQREAGGDTERYTAYTSQDGQTWVRGGVWTHSLGDDAQIGLVSMGATDQVTQPDHRGVRLRARLLA